MKPEDYILIAKKSSDYEDRVTGYTYLRRLSPFMKVPLCWKKVIDIKSIPVYTEKGKLKPRYWCIKRLINGY